MERMVERVLGGFSAAWGRLSSPPQERHVSVNDGRRAAGPALDHQEALRFLMARPYEPVAKFEPAESAEIEPTESSGAYSTHGWYDKETLYEYSPAAIDYEEEKKRIAANERFYRLLTQLERGCYSSELILSEEYSSEPWPVKAFTQFKKSAQNGNLIAATWLASMYLRGVGVPEDRGAASYWLQKAIDQGCSEAYVLRADCYAGGVGMPQQHKAAFGWYLKAARMGNPKGQYSLGLMYCKGLGVPVLMEVSSRWMRLAANQGFEPAMRFLRGGTEVHCHFAQPLLTTQGGKCRGRPRGLQLQGLVLGCFWSLRCFFYHLTDPLKHEKAFYESIYFPLERATTTSSPSSRSGRAVSDCLYALYLKCLRGVRSCFFKSTPP